MNNRCMLLSLSLTFVLISCKENPVSSTSGFWVLEAGPDSLSIQALVTDSKGRVFAEADGVLFRSTDNGRSWMRVSPSTMLLGGPIVVSGNDNLYAGVYAGGESGVACSTDGGASWTMRGSDLSAYGYIQGLAIDPDGRIFVVTCLFRGNMLPSDGHIFRSTDNGNSWEQIVFTPGIPIGPITVAPNNHVFTVGEGIIFRSTDDGMSWKQVYNTPDWIDGFAISPKGELIAGTESSGATGDTSIILRSTNDGDTWTQLCTGLSNMHVTGLTINGSGYVHLLTWSGAFLTSSQALF